jgi:sec-independent protein translocase protein TatA
MGRGLFQPMHLILILVIVLIIFGPGKLPQLGESLGKSIRGFKKVMSEKEDDKVMEAKKEEKKP